MKPKRRVFESNAVLQELRESLLQVGVLALVLPCEAALAPDVCPALTAGCFGRALFEREPLAFWVGGDGINDAQQSAELVEVRL